jgi:metallophosphoesterase superfamily enzyme
VTRRLIINDLHLGVQRSGGTTISSAEALRKFAHDKHAALLQLAVKHNCDVVTVNGDLADQYDIPLSEGIEILATAKLFLEGNPDKELEWGLGNHDLAKDSSKLGIVAFLGVILEGWFPGRFRLIRKPTLLSAGVYMIPHLVNQEQFDLALSQVPDEAKTVLLHCNYENTFAGALDHSLNVSREQVRKLRDRGMTVVLGHEHLARTLMNGHLVIVGNQFPTSVVDCLAHGDAQKDGKKYALIVNEDGSFDHIQTWSKDDDDGWFAEADWQELGELSEDGRGFVRVVGEAAATQAADVVKAIAQFRQRSHSFVVTNAVQVEGLDTTDDEIVTQEDIRRIDVIGLLLGMLDERQAAKIRELTGRTEAQPEEEADVAS